MVSALHIFLCVMSSPNFVVKEWDTPVRRAWSGDGLLQWSLFSALPWLWRSFVQQCLLGMTLHEEAGMEEADIRCAR